MSSPGVLLKNYTKKKNRLIDKYIIALTILQRALSKKDESHCQICMAC